jgi:hypothetical protein
LADALRQAKTQELTAAYLDHKISLAEATETMRLFELEVNELATAQLTAAQNAETHTAANSPLTDGMNNAALAAENLANKLNALPTEKTINVNTNYTESGTPTNAGPAGPPTSAPTAPGAGPMGGAMSVISPPTTSPTRPGGNAPQGGNTFIFQGFTPAEIMNMIQKAFAGEASKIRGRAASGGTRGK